MRHRWVTLAVLAASAIVMGGETTAAAPQAPNANATAVSAANRIRRHQRVHRHAWDRREDVRDRRENRRDRREDVRDRREDRRDRMHQGGRRDFREDIRDRREDRRDRREDVRDRREDRRDFRRPPRPRRG